MYERRAHDLGGLSLQPLTHSNAEILGQALASMEPWATIGWPPERMVRALQHERPSMHRFEVLAGAGLAGIITIQEPWLHGPYLQLLAILPAHQGKGFGQRLLTWMEAEARSSEMRQLWLCVSTFNTKARRLYERFGFHPQSVIEQLASGASDELLMRKRLHYG
jgi:ribosomal protein S18 acetylase RimI-like enzyme